MRSDRTSTFGSVRAWLITVLIGLALGLLLLILTCGVCFVRPLVIISSRAERGQKHLFYETDYYELLAACRELSDRVDEGELKAGQYHVFFGERDPETSSFPQVILDLEPSLVSIDAHGLVRVELLPGPEYFGVAVFPEGQAGWGEIKLIDGLWYYNSDYREEYPKYMKKIDAMVEQGRRHKAARQTAKEQDLSGTRNRVTTEEPNDGR